MNANKNEKYKRNCLKKLMWWEKEEDGYKIKFVEFFASLFDAVFLSGTVVLGKFCWNV